jgi:hypothetical protein
MARLANQLIQVLATYTTRPWTWGSIWVPLGCVAFALRVNRDDPQAFSLFAGFFVGTMFADLVRDQTRLQFAHPRSALLPGFALPHLLAVVLFAVCAAVLTPAIITTTLRGELLFMAAVASLTFALISRQYKFIHSEHLRTVFPTLMVATIVSMYLYVAMALWGSENTALTPASSITLIAASWAFLAVNFVRLVRLREDETAYASEHSTADRRQAVRHWYPQPTVFYPKRYTRKWVLSDMWNDRIRGFHHESRQRIIRLLRHGGGALPPEFLTILFIAVAVLYSFRTIYLEKIGELSDSNLPPQATIRLVPILFGLLLPSTVAGPVALNRAALSAKLLLPLTRKQLIDNAIVASAWNFAVLWIPFSALSMYLIWAVPGLDLSLLRVATFAFISGATSVAAFCLGVSLAVWKSFFVATLAAIFSAFLAPALFLTWWFARDTTTDVPFWIISGFALSLGLWAMRRARLAWLNTELG